MDLMKKNMTKDNAVKAGNFAYNNTKMVGGFAMSAMSSMMTNNNQNQNNQKAAPQKKKDDDDFFSNFANVKL